MRQSHIPTVGGIMFLYLSVVSLITRLLPN